MKLVSINQQPIIPQVNSKYRPQFHFYILDQNLDYQTSRRNRSNHQLFVNFLKVNIKKTEEIIFDPKSICDHMPVSVYNQEITQVQSYKYLVVHIDKSLTWDINVNWVCERFHQRLYYLCRLWFYGVDRKMIYVFHQSIL